jgi:GAF domain-containing protein
VLNGDMLAEVLERRNAVIIPDLAETNISPELRRLAEKHSVTSILAVPIHTKDTVLCAFVSLSNEARIFTYEDLTTASAVAEFTAIALENANLFAELQRTAITDR